MVKHSLKRHDFVAGGPSKYTIYITDSSGQIIGFKGTTFFEPGYVYAPYVPMIIEPEPFQPRRSLASRYGTKMVNNSFYGTITTSSFSEVVLPSVNRTFA